jgi:AraC family transcriptional regulator of adaptative response/methylated-DNA-[protein]-cysteine methyltransferase
MGWIFAKSKERMMVQSTLEEASRTAPRRFSTEAERWQAVCLRDRQADGVFLYSVASTGVYCRPSCAARRPRRENIAFHASCAEAERAGFRPCKRCRPDQAPAQAAAIAKACRLIEESEEMPRLDALAAAVGLSPYYFHRSFKAATGLTPRAYAAGHRGQRLRDALGRRATVTEAFYGAGFNSSGRFYAAASDLLGMTPSAYRTGGDGTEIRFAVGECSLGSLLVAATPKGVCAIALGDDPQKLVDELQDRFPKAVLIGGDTAFEALVATVVGLVEAPARGHDLPLDIRGTTFQQQVWQAIRGIPAGSTVTYAEIAERIGRPQAVRAVAQACAANALALAIPCHRVVRRDGAPSGYRWGIARKAVLLSREKEQ